jgi:CBS domain containing-hemolysin-like protein
LDYLSAPIFLLQINAQAMPALIFILLLLLAFSFMISGSEVAFFSLNYKDINLLKTKQTEPYRRIVNLLESPKTLLASMLIANSFINIAIIVISNLMLKSLFDSFEFLNHFADVILQLFNLDTPFHTFVILHVNSPISQIVHQLQILFF